MEMLWSSRHFTTSFAMFLKVFSYFYYNFIANNVTNLHIIMIGTRSHSKYLIHIIYDEASFEIENTGEKEG